MGERGGTGTPESNRDGEERGEKEEISVGTAKINDCLKDNMET